MAPLPSRHLQDSTSTPPARTRPYFTVSYEAGAFLSPGTTNTGFLLHPPRLAAEAPPRRPAERSRAAPAFTSSTPGTRSPATAGGTSGWRPRTGEGWEMPPAAGHLPRGGAVRGRTAARRPPSAPQAPLRAAGERGGGCQGSPGPSARRDGERSERFYLLLFLSSPELAAEEEEQQQEEKEAAPGRQVQQPPRRPATRRHVPRTPAAGLRRGAPAAPLPTSSPLIGLGLRPIAARRGRGGCWEM